MMYSYSTSTCISSTSASLSLVYNNISAQTPTQLIKVTTALSNSNFNRSSCKCQIFSSNEFKIGKSLFRKSAAEQLFDLVGTTTTTKSYRPHKLGFSAPVMQWQDCTVKMEVDVPASVAYKCYADREAIPKWMPFISSVKVLEEKPELSRWTLKYKAFGRDIELSWLARNLQPIPNQKIHWRSLEGLPNGGAVRFYPKGPSSCFVELTVSLKFLNFLFQSLQHYSLFSKVYFFGVWKGFQILQKDINQMQLPDILCSAHFHAGSSCAVKRLFGCCYKPETTTQWLALRGFNL